MYNSAGPVVIPLLREYVVEEGWVTQRDFLLSLAIIQAMYGIGPVFASRANALSGLDPTSTWQFALEPWLSAAPARIWLLALSLATLPSLRRAICFARVFRAFGGSYAGRSG